MRLRADQIERFRSAGYLAVPGFYTQRGYRWGR